MQPFNALQNALTPVAITPYPATTASTAAHTPGSPTLPPSLTDLKPLASTVLLGSAHPTPGNPWLSTDAAKDTTKNKLDSLSELGETESLRLQTAMDRLSKLMQTLSNVLTKITNTASGIASNIK